MLVKVGEQCWVEASRVISLRVTEEWDKWKIAISMDGQDDEQDIGLYDLESVAKKAAEELVDELNGLSY